MSFTITLKHKFVEYIPDNLEDKTIYICMEFATASHKCVCGCGQEVITPFTPTDWSLVFDGESISLNPSIGNWSFPCQSHYWIKRNKIQWSEKWSKEKISVGRTHDTLLKKQHLENKQTSDIHENIFSDKALPKKSVWKKIKGWLF
jgi:Family of unknown function (DUF6527)